MDQSKKRKLKKRGKTWNRGETRQGKGSIAVHFVHNKLKKKMSYLL